MEVARATLCGFVSYASRTRAYMPDPGGYRRGVWLVAAVGVLVRKERARDREFGEAGSGGRMCVGVGDALSRRDITYR